MSVIIGRALPDVRDGLKPVHRRILYTMQQMGLQPNRATRKCARIVGDVMGKYHPHGNLAVYDALVRLAQTWSLRYPLIFGQGIFGSVDGDLPAADRYTEAKLAAVSTALLEDSRQRNRRLSAPTTMAAKSSPTFSPRAFPTLLINGSDGIASAWPQKIPPHNLTEIIDATITLVNNPNAQLAEILKFVQGPDFPTAGNHPRPSRNFEAYRTGRGRFMMRAKAAIENVTKDKQAIIVTEIPLPGKQVRPRQTHRSTRQRQRNRRHLRRSRRERPRRHAHRHRTQARYRARKSFSTSSTNTPPCRKVFSMILLAVVNGAPRELGPHPGHQSTSSITASKSSAAAPRSCCRKPKTASTSSKAISTHSIISTT